jgi:putative DNA methylase
MTETVKTRKKLIEVALPLEAINKASAREKSIRHGHPSTLHLWWARRPLAAARAVIFSQMVDDPSSHPDQFPTPEEQDEERQRLFRIIEELVLWENTTNEQVLEAAREEIRRSWRATCADNRDHPRAVELFNPDKLPAFHDPFAGGGSLPLEAQRLGLEAYASDLNPVAVLINKAMIEIPPKFAGRSPVNPESRKMLTPTGWQGASGLAEDVRYYGQWMRDEAEKSIGHLYPQIEVTAAMVKERPDLKAYLGKKLTVIAWLWARTVKSPNPAFANVDVPLATTFMLSTKAGKEAYVEPIIAAGDYRFAVKVGKPRDADAAKLGTSGGKRSAFRCLMSDVPVTYEYIRQEGKAKRMGARLMTIVAKGERGREYLAPTPEMEDIAITARPTWRPDATLPVNPRDFKTPNYGLTTFADLFTSRQLVALTTFSDQIQAARDLVQRDALIAGLPDPSADSGQAGRTLSDGGTGATAYSEALGMYLGFCVDKMADTNTCLCSWQVDPPRLRATFGRQALPMVWDYAEANIFGDAAGDFGRCVQSLTEVLDRQSLAGQGHAQQQDAQALAVQVPCVFSTDPPYYDNIGYADLSDFFYVWLRRSLRPIFPDLFATVAVPKAEELVATPYRHGSKEKAEAFFLGGMTRAMHRLADQAHPAFPVTIYYAFKQSEGKSATGAASTGWETFLDAVIRAGFEVSGTWPMRSELATRNVGRNTNALASSIVLVCRPRSANALTATRRDFLAALKAELPVALINMQRGNIAPVDLAQASIGPGMAIYTRYAKVVNADGGTMTVREALALINQTLGEALAEQEGDFDADTRWALAWFEQSGFATGEYGTAETLSRAKDTSVGGMVEAGILVSKGGKVRLLSPSELPEDWDPASDTRLTVWVGVHHLIRALEAGGEGAAAVLAAKLGSKAEPARELAYWLYNLCERKKWAKEALSYNGLVQSWPEIMRLANAGAKGTPVQGRFGDDEEEE